MKKTKNLKILVFVFALILIGIGYSFLTSDLKILGTARIRNVKWDIHFDNARKTYASSSVTYLSNSNSNIEPGDPIIKGEERQELEWEVIFNEPGDYYEFETDIVNAGNIDAMLDYENSFLKVKVGDEEEISVSLEQYTNRYYPWLDIRNFQHNDLPSYLEISLEGNMVFLEAGETKGLEGYIGIKNNIASEEWENLQGKDITMSLTLRYLQNSNHPYSTYVYLINPVLTNGGELPTIVNDNGTYPGSGIHTVEFNTILNNPGDYYEFSVDVMNDGGHSAALDLNERTIKIGDGDVIDFYDLEDLPEGLIYTTENIGTNYTSYYTKICEYNKKTVKIRLSIDPNATDEVLNNLRGKKITVSYELHSGEYGSSGPEICG